MPKTISSRVWGPFPVRKMKPTLKHRIALRECMLGTVYAVDDRGVEKYFDYDWEAAHRHAGIDQTGRDPRLAKNPDNGRIALYILRSAR